MTDRVIDFLKRHVEELDTLKIQDLYDGWLKEFSIRGVYELTQALFELELDPLLFLKTIPCNSLNSVEANIPKVVIDSNTILQPQHFRNAVGIQSVLLKSSVNMIPTGCFTDCVNLKTINLDKVDTRIDNNAFSGCTALNNIVFNDELRKIGIRAFCNTGITSVEIPTCIVAVNAFSNCTSLTTVVSRGMLGSYSFSGCDSLTSVTIDGGDYSMIQDCVFDGCPNLTEVTFEGTKSEFIQRVHPKWRGNAPINKVVCTDGIMKLKVN